MGLGGEKENATTSTRILKIPTFGGVGESRNLVISGGIFYCYFFFFFDSFLCVARRR